MADVTVNADDIRVVLDTAVGFAFMPAEVYAARLRLRDALERHAMLRIGFNVEAVIDAEGNYYAINMECEVCGERGYKNAQVLIDHALTHRAEPWSVAERGSSSTPPDDDQATCSNCHGRGGITIPHSVSWARCPYCHGTGKVPIDSAVTTTNVVTASCRNWPERAEP